MCHCSLRSQWIPCGFLVSTGIPTGVHLDSWSIQLMYSWLDCSLWIPPGFHWKKFLVVHMEFALQPGIQWESSGTRNHENGREFEKLAVFDRDWESRWTPAGFPVIPGDSR